MLDTQDFLLKGRAKVEANPIKRKLDTCAVQECLDLIDKDTDLQTGRSLRIGEELLDSLFGRQFGLG